MIPEMLSDYHLPALSYTWQDKRFILGEAESLLGKEYPSLPCSSYMAFTQNGDRIVFEEPYFRRRNMSGCVLPQLRRGRSGIILLPVLRNSSVSSLPAFPRLAGSSLEKARRRSSKIPTPCADKQRIIQPVEDVGGSECFCVVVPRRMFRPERKMLGDDILFQFDTGQEQPYQREQPDKDDQYVEDAQQYGVRFVSFPIGGIVHHLRPPCFCPTRRTG